MRVLTVLGNEAKQSFEVYLETGEKVEFTFNYVANQLGWFFGFRYADVDYQNIRLTTSYNLLRAYRSWLPFGLRCDTLDNEEPMGIDDFVDGYAVVCILDKTDMINTEAEYYAKL